MAATLVRWLSPLLVRKGKLYRPTRSSVEQTCDASLAFLVPCLGIEADKGRKQQAEKRAVEFTL
jgi:hypothetical protein